MRMTRMTFQTLREAPVDTEAPSYRLLLRAGMIRQVAAGIFAFLPLGQRVKRKIEAIVRQEMDAIGGQEISMPVVQPAELWRRSGRWDRLGADLARFKDRDGHDLCLGMTHEEVATELSGYLIKSYRQMPCMLYQIQTGFRDDPRPRGGLIRVREFTMKDAYSFHADFADLDAYYPEVYRAYCNVFRRCGLDAIAVESDPGMMGGATAHGFVLLTPTGEETILMCDACGYRANRQVAAMQKPDPPDEEALPLEEVHTPGAMTIDALAAYLGIPASRTAKAVFLMAETAGGHGDAGERFVFVVLRGDMALNETKLTNAIRATRLRPALEDEIRSIGAEPGFGSPIGIDRDRALVVADDLIPRSPNLVAGANRPDYHLKHVNYGRDYTADIVADIAAADDGDACPACGEPLRAARGIEVGNTFKLGNQYTKTMDALFLDANNTARPAVMGCYGIGIDRLMAAVVEVHHDDDGIIWPLSIAPFQVALVSLTADDSDIVRAADTVYERLTATGLEALYDDRGDRAGVKFKDADLIGIPVRLTVGAKGLKKGVVEVKIRRTGERLEIPFDDHLEDGVLKLLDREGAVILDRLEEGQRGEKTNG